MSWFKDEADLDAPIGALTADITDLDEDPRLVHATARLIRNSVGTPMPDYWLPGMSEAALDLKAAAAGATS